MIKNAISKTIILIGLLSSACSCSCSKRERHFHEYSQNWYYNAKKHWHECTFSGCDEKTDEGLHDYEDDGWGNVCKICGYSEDSGTVSTRCQHNWSDWEAVEEPTCIDEGLRLRYCFYCGKTQSGIMDRDTIYGHMFVEDEASNYPATCTKNGAEGYQICLRCGQKKKGETVPALGLFLDNQLF